MTYKPTRWDVFISHAAEDKEEIARPLARELQRYGLKVWFDEFTLKAGDSLRRSVDYGLANSRYGIVIISKHFISKRWPQDELAGLASRDDGSNKIIIPIWYNISYEEVRAWSPILVDKIAILYSGNIYEVVKQLLRAIDLPFTSQSLEDCQKSNWYYTASYASIIRATTLLGYWSGNNGRLRLFQIANADTRLYEYHEGDYDWNGHEWAGHLEGMYSLQENIFRFRWFWDISPEKGIGYFKIDDAGESLKGGWRFSDEDTGFFDVFTYPLQDLRQQCNAWRYFRMILHSKGDSLTSA